MQHHRCVVACMHFFLLSVLVLLKKMKCVPSGAKIINSRCSSYIAAMCESGPEFEQLWCWVLQWLFGLDCDSVY